MHQELPNCHTLLNLLNQLCNGNKNIECGFLNCGMMWCVLPEQLYHAITCEQVITPLHPQWYHPTILM